MPDEHKNLNHLAVCWMGNPRYTQPLNPTDDKKWRALNGLGVRMFVIGFATRIRPRHFRQHAEFYLLPALPAAPLRYLTVLFWGVALALWLVLRHNVSVIIAQSPYEGMVSGLVKQTARLIGKPVRLIVETHGDFEQVLFQQRQVSFQGLYRRIMSWSAAYALRQADVLRAVSQATEEQLHKYAPGKPVVRLMAWTDSTVFRETPRAVPLADAQDIIYAGVLTPLKGVHFLVKAFAQISSDFPTAHLYLVGKLQDTEYVAKLKEAVSTHHLTERVHFTGAVNQQELATFMGRGRVLVLPSTTEGMGRVLVEALLCGTPVIGSNVGGIPDVIQDGVNGYLFPPGDVNALSQRLTDILRDPHIDDMGTRGRAFAERLFSEAAYVEGHRHMLETALDEAKTP